ncbi:MAG TPA: nucleoid-associated protein [Cytophagaceae bacterium]|nr:nucleoid-associated protein [Cytophagaceae bacterium]
MINTETSIVNNLVVHYIGNKHDEEGMILAKSALSIEDNAVESLLMKYLLSPFKKNEFYHLTNEGDLNLNPIYSVASKIFADPGAFFLQSVNVAKHLYEQSTHPMVKGGELYMIYLQGCIVNDEPADAIGIFKSETKEIYLKVAATADNFEISSDQGININKLDKGCLIFNLDEEKGYRVCSVDVTNKGEEARYWKNDFLNLRAREDSFYHTQNYMQLCKDFIDEKLKEEFEISKTDEIDLLNRSANFFKEREEFNLNDFKQEVIQQPEVIDAFRQYKESYQQDHDVVIADEFNISHNAVKNSSRIFKSILKLDKNFSIYIHGKKEYITKGYDEEKGMNFYQFFYREEK